MSEEENVEIIIDTVIPEYIIVDDRIDEGSVEQFDEFDPEKDDK